MSDRDRYVAKHRTPPLGVPEPVWEDATDRYEGEELQRIRARRPTPERLRKLEIKQDEDRKAHLELVKIVTDTRVDVAGLRGELKVLPELVELIKGKEQTERLRLNTRAKVIIAAIPLLTAVAGYLLGGCA